MFVCVHAPGLVHISKSGLSLMNSPLFLMKSGGAMPLGRLLGCSHLLLAIFFYFFKNYVCLCACVCVGVCMHVGGVNVCMHVHGCVLKCMPCVCRCSERPGKDPESARAGVRGSCHLPSMGTGNRMKVKILTKAVRACNY